jgi:hypothetical protein
MRVSFVCVCTVGLTVLVWRGAWTAILSCASHTRRCQQHVQGRALPLTLEAQLLASTHGCWAGALRALQGRGVLCRPPTALQRMRPHRQLLAVAAGGLHVSVCMRSYCVPSRWPSAVIRFWAAFTAWLTHVSGHVCCRSLSFSVDWERPRACACCARMCCAWSRRMSRPRLVSGLNSRLGSISSLS